MENHNLLEIVERYYEFRGLTQPDKNQAFLFLTSEVGELADALVADQADWVRNNPDKHRSVSDEIGDVLMMLTVFSTTMGIDPVQAMLEKMKRKSFTFSRE